jgi:hypothetical protein
MLESRIQGHFIEEVKSCDLGLAVKVDCSSQRGWPDVLYVDWRGEITLIEFKQLGEKLTGHQPDMHAELNALNVDVIILAGMPETDYYLDVLRREKTGRA